MLMGLFQGRSKDAISIVNWCGGFWGDEVVLGALARRACKRVEN